MNLERVAQHVAVSDLLQRELGEHPATVTTMGTVTVAGYTTLAAVKEAKRILKLHGYQVQQAGNMLAVGPQIKGSPFIDQRLFQHVFQQHLAHDPEANYKLYRNLIAEELKELDCATTPEEHLDALIDLIYVTIGAGIALGHDMQGAWDEIHSTNMAKLGPDGKPIIREDGKVIKPEGWKGPQLTPFIGHRLPVLPLPLEA